MKFITDKTFKSGVYKITNIVNKKCYVGSTTGLLKNRYSDHNTKLKHNKHKNLHLQNSYNKYGKENFEFSLLELCDVTKTLEREQYHIDTLHPEYNIIQFAGEGIKGYKHSDKTKFIISESQKGEKHWGYNGKYVFFNINVGYLIEDMKTFSKKTNIIYSAVHKLCIGVINYYKSWICLGKLTNDFIYPNDIDFLYRNILNKHKKYYAFFKKPNLKFVGTFGEFLKKYNLKRNNLKGIVNKSRFSASGWICLGECKYDYQFPNNIEDVYENNMRLNKRFTT